MNNLIIEKYPCDERFPYSEKELKCLAELEKITDADIDLSDIPEITEEEWRTRFKPVRLRRKNLQKAAG